MKLSSLSLEAFFACAQMGNFTKAAERLHITQSALSQRILKLEEELGCTLLIRDKAGPRLTEAGEELLRYCQKQQEMEEEVLHRLQGENPQHLAGPIRIGGFSTSMRSLILPALAPLLAAHPALRIQLAIRELEELPSMLRSGQIDFMILDQKMDREGLEGHFLGEEVNVLVQKRGYTGGKIYLDHDENDQTTLHYFKLRPDKRIERHYLDDIYGIIDGVKLGLGQAVVPMHLIAKEKNLEILNPHTQLKVPHVLHHYRGTYYTLLHQTVVSLLKEAVPRILAASYR